MFYSQQIQTVPPDASPRKELMGLQRPNPTCLPALSPNGCFVESRIRAGCLSPPRSTDCIVAYSKLLQRRASLSRQRACLAKLLRPRRYTVAYFLINSAHLNDSAILATWFGCAWYSQNASTLSVGPTRPARYQCTARCRLMHRLWSARLFSLPALTPAALMLAPLFQKRKLILVLLI